MSDDAATPKRLSLSAIVEMLLTRPVDHSTIKLVRNAKGEMQIDVNIRTGAEPGIDTADDANAKAQAIFDGLLEKYPMAPATDDADVTLTRNAKGDTQISLGMKTSDRHGSRSLTEVIDAASDHYEALRGRFPTADGTVGKGPPGV